MVAFGISHESVCLTDKEEAHMNSGKAENLGLLVLRVGIGLSFMINHGIPKLLGGREVWAGLGAAMSAYGIDFAPAFWGFMAGVAEGVGGLFLVIGLLTRPFAALLTFTMLTAMLLHLNLGESMKALYPLEMGLVFLALIVSGPGRYSLKQSIPACRRRWYL